MGKPFNRYRLVGYLALLALSAALPACKSADGTRPWIFGGSKADASNTVMRPSYQWPETKPLFVSGYAGATYEPRARIRPMFESPAPAAVPVETPSVTIRQGSWDSN